MKTYGYARVSTTEQKLDRQLDEFEKYNTDKIYSDKLSGKNLDRIEYQKMRKKLKSGDLLIISSIDRLGRDYEMVTEEWRYLTKELGVDIKVIDMPILDTQVSENNLMGKLISDIVLQLLSYVAETEREKTRARQRAGIEAARKRGVHMGKPAYKLPDNFDELCERYWNKEIKLKEVIKLLGMKPSTFYKYYSIKYNIVKKTRIIISKEDIEKYIRDFIEGKVTRQDILESTGKDYAWLKNELDKSSLYQKSIKFDNVILENKRLLKVSRDQAERKEIRQRIKILENVSEKHKKELLNT